MRKPKEHIFIRRKVNETFMIKKDEKIAITDMINGLKT